MSGIPPAPPAWAAAVARLADGLGPLGHTLSAQGAYGWMFRGRCKDARSVLEALPTATIQQVSAAAVALAAVADDILAGRSK